MMRTEHDMLGAMPVPADFYAGIHTARAAANFPLPGARVHPAILRAMAEVKAACARANARLGYLPEDVAQAIQQACRDLSSGLLAPPCPLPALQGGAGTSTNMFVNEILANRAQESLGLPLGSYERVHPLRHVNLHQSTNDVFPTAVRIALIRRVRALSESIASLQGVLQSKESEFAGVVTMGRTELQDAVPITLGAQFAAFAEALARDRWRVQKCQERLRVVNLGGTAVGTGLAAPREYIFLAIEELRAGTHLNLARGDQVMDQTANQDALAEVSGILSAHAANVLKLCRDLRLLHCFGEIRLPAVQAGSSIMPGKVNPVILECCIQAAMRAQANDGLVTRAVSSGTLQINEFLPLIAESMLESLDLLDAACGMLAGHVPGITADADRCRLRADASTTLITAFLPQLGYEGAENMLRDYLAAPDPPTFRAFLEERLGAGCVAETLSPERIMALGFARPNGAAQGGG